jgi:hypothetical protein
VRVDSGANIMTRLRSVCGFAAILASCLAGAFGISAWAICAGAAVLVLISLGHQQSHYARYANQGSVAAQPLLLVGSTLNAVTASAVAFGLGCAIGWMWGI